MMHGQKNIKFSYSLLWIWNQNSVILDINYLFLLMSYIVRCFLI